MLKILLCNDVLPHINNRTTIFFRKFVPLLSKKFEIKVYWLITDDYGERHEVTDPHYEILFMSDFKNAIEVFEKIRPDVVYNLIGWNVVDYAFIIARKFFKIPSFGYVSEYPDEADMFFEQDSKWKIKFKQLEQFFEIKNIEDRNQIKKIRGVIYIKKVLFLLKTIRATERSWITSIIKLLDFYRLSKPKSVIGRYSKFNCDLMFAETSHQVETLVKWGLKRENIVIVGNPAYDDAFVAREQPPNNFNNNLNILFVTANLSGGQGKSNWSKSRRDQMIKELVNNLSNLNHEISLTVKIHPTSENYDEYRKLLEPYKNVHLSQIADIIDLFTKSDVVITPCTSTAAMIALIMKKPIIIWNYFQLEGDLFLRKGVALECKNSLELHDCVNAAKSFREHNEEKINELINEFSDGKTTQRIVFELEKWLKSNALV